MACSQRGKEYRVPNDALHELPISRPSAMAAAFHCGYTNSQRMRKYADTASTEDHIKYGQNSFP